MDVSAKIEQLTAAFKRGDAVVDNGLNVIFRGGRYWFLLCLITPFFYLFGRDPFSHVRIQVVANEIFKFIAREFPGKEEDLAPKINDLYNAMEARTRRCFIDRNFYLRIDEDLLDKSVNAWHENREVKTFWPLPEYEKKIFPPEVVSYQSSEMQKLAGAYARIAEFCASSKIWSLKKATDDGDKLTIEVECQAINRKEKVTKIFPHSRLIHPPFCVHDGTQRMFLVPTGKAAGIRRGGKYIVEYYDILSDEKRVKKPLHSQEELKILEECRRLSHPQLVKVFATGMEGSDPYSIEFRYRQALSFFYNQPISKGNQQRFLDEWAVRHQLMGDILKGVDALHIKGMFHLDIKPDNVLVNMGPSGLSAVLTDFEDPLKVKFSIGYGSPEAAFTFLHSLERNAEKIRAKSDVWSAGLVLLDLIHPRVPAFDSLEGSECLFLSRLPCIHQTVLNGRHVGPLDWQKVWKAMSSLKQEKIDKNLGQIKQEIIGEDERLVLGLIQEDMLQANPSKRSKINTVLGKFRWI